MRYETGMCKSQQYGEVCLGSAPRGEELNENGLASSFSIPIFRSQLDSRRASDKHGDSSKSLHFEPNRDLVRTFRTKLVLLVE